jgi:hypothetical protein
MKLNEEQLWELEDAVGYFDNAEIISYSGRGMYGRQCLGITFDSMKDAFDFALCVGEENDLSLALSRPTFDDMGLGIVVYWPRVEAPEGLDESDELDEVLL